MRRRVTGSGSAQCGLWLVATAVMLALAPATNADWLPQGDSAPTVAVPESMPQILLSFAPLVEAASPAVVNIETSVFVEGSGSRLYDDPFYREFFGDRRRYSGPGSTTAPTPREEPLSLGSGVILSPDGIVVTNNHVVEGADAITVVLADRREFSAELVGTDPDTDLAVLRISVDGGGLSYLDLGDPDQVAVGDLVLAIGNPFGVGQTVTSGIISALARTDIGVSDYSFFIQTDAPINPGNSGGALVTMDGRLIGINTAIFSQSGGSHGIGFAIPANMVHRVVTAVIEGGSVIRPWLGLSTENVTAELAVEIGLSRPYGALVVDVVPDGPADRAELQAGDVVLSIDGHELENSEAGHFRIGTYAPGDRVRLLVRRNGEQFEVTTALAAPPSSQIASQAVLVDGHNPLTGAEVVAMTRALMNEFQLGQMRGGALVTAVAVNSPADDIGLQAGDIVVGMNGREVVNLDGLAEILENPRPLWRISIVRDGELLSVTVRG